MTTHPLVARPDATAPGRAPEENPGATDALGHRPVVRLAGLPVSVLTGLRFTDTAALVDRVVTGDDWLTTEGRALAGSLHEVIGGVGEGPLRPRLVGLRRALHQVRPPARTEWGAEVRAVLPAALAARVDHWLERLRAWRQDRSRLSGVLVDEERRRAEALRSITADPGFRRGLWQSSRSLSGVLDRWLADPGRRPRRQSISRLAKYVSRAATKTSPNSAFAVSGMGEWSATGGALRIPVAPSRRGVIELYGHRRDDLVEALVRHPGLWRSTRVRVNPSLSHQDHRLRFLGRPPAEPVLAVPATDAVLRCVDILGSGGSSTLGDLRARLVADSGGDPGAVVRFLTHLVEIGLLEAGPPVSGDLTTTEQLVAWVDEHGGDELSDVAQLLRRLVGDLTEPVPVPDLDPHRARQESLQDTFRALTRRLQIEPAQRDGRYGTQDAAAHDSVVCTGALARCGVRAWRPALEDLDRLRRWLALFEPALPLRVALGELWLTRFRPGDRVPFLTLHRVVHEAAAGRGPRAAELRRLLSGGAVGPDGRESQFARVRELRRLRERALRPLRRHGGNGNGEGNGVVRVDPADLAGMAAGWPSWVGAIGSLGCYAQPLWSEEGLALVLNASGAGYGRGRGRVAHLLSLAGEEPGRDLAVAPPVTHPRLAELAGPNGSSLNDRVPSVPYEIDYPFTRSRRPPGQRLALGDLVVEHDRDSGLLRLRSDRLGARVKALALGLLMLPALPPAARLLVQVFGEVPTIQFSRLPRRAPPRSEVRELPRVVAGRVVLHRASWVVNAADMPVHTPGEADVDHLLRLTRWRRGAGVPSRCFVRALPADPDETGMLMLHKARKPVYIDFDNWFLVLALEKMIRPPAQVLAFEEALPDPEGVTEPAGAARVVEVLVETGERED